MIKFPERLLAVRVIAWLVHNWLRTLWCEMGRIFCWCALTWNGEFELSVIVELQYFSTYFSPGFGCFAFLIYNQFGFAARQFLCSIQHVLVLLRLEILDWLWRSWSRCWRFLCLCIVLELGLLARIGSSLWPSLPSISRKLLSYHLQVQLIIMFYN